MLLKRKYILFILLLLLVTGCAHKKSIPATLAPDQGQRLVAEHAMVSSAQPLASEIGAQIMKQGGNAVDAAVATGFALGVVEPEMSGLGGGGAMVVWLNDKKKGIYIDFYASKRVETYKEITKEDKIGPDLLKVGIPGLVAGLLYAQKEYGNLTRQEVMQPAIDLAREGYPMYKVLALEIKDNASKLKHYAGGNKYLPNGKPYPVGKLFKAEELAKSLELISEKGVSAFYKGPLAKDIIKVLNKGNNPVSKRDFKGYKVRTDKKPQVTTYKQWIALSAGPPQTGTEVLEDLNLLEPYNLKELGLPTQSDSAFHLLTAALRAGRADWHKFNNDPNWVKVPTQTLKSKYFAKSRTDSVYRVPVPHKMEAADVSEFQGNGVDSVMDHNTTSFSVVDTHGNAVAVTQTLSSAFGSGAWVDGFFLNDSGINLLREKQQQSKIKPDVKYRTRITTISPTVILSKDSTVKLVIGGAGGGRIPTEVAQNIVYMLDYGMGPRAAVRMPRIYPYINSTTVLLEKGFKGSVLNAARKKGYRFTPTFTYHGRTYAIEKKNGHWVGAADPFHEGGVRGY
jgi:gamma-glutamyltranspeptidase/glutathione hydrolase